MKEEEKNYINHLFELTRKEPPQRSFEEVATHFENTMISTVPKTSNWSALLTKSIYLNSLLIIITGVLLILFFFWFEPLDTEQVLIEASPKQELSKSIITHKSRFPKTYDKQVLDANKNEKKEITSTHPIKRVTTIGTNLKKKTTLTDHSKTISTSQKKSQQVYPKKTIILNTLPIDTANLLKLIPSIKKLPTSAILSNDEPISNQAKTSIHSVNTNINKKEITDTHEILFHLKHTDDENTATAFLDRIRAHGFKISERFNRGGNKIQRVNLRFTYYKGLDWKMKLRNFEHLEIKVILDGQKNPTGIAYRLNQIGDFSKPLNLYDTGRSKHKFSKVHRNGHHTFTRHSTQKN